MGDIIKRQLASIEPASFAEAEALALKMSESSLLPEGLRGKPADVLAIGLMGRDLELSFSQSLRGIYVIEGKPFMSADLMVAIILRSGLAVHFTCTETTSTQARYETQRGNAKPVGLTYTLKQAERAGLASRKIWQANPEDMLRHRAAAKLARMVYPDVVFGIYVQGEEWNDVIEVTPVVTPTAPAKPAEDDDVMVRKVLGRLRELGVETADAIEYTGGGLDALIDLGKRIKSGELDAAAVHADPRDPPHDAVTGEVMDFDPDRIGGGK